MFDLVIVGTGAAGFSAAIYAARSKMKTLVIGSEIGGTTAKAWEIENYPGFKKILGRDLMEKMKKQVEDLGVEVRPGTVNEIVKNEDYFSIKTVVSGDIEAKTVILATGTKNRHVGVVGEKEFYGKGVSYCATCDGYFFRDKTVAIIGGGDSAATAGLFLGEICKKVYIIFRKPEMRAEPFWIDALERNEKVEFVSQKNVAEIGGSAKVEFVKLDDGSQLAVDGVFVQIGADPETMLADKIGAEKDEFGFIQVDKTQETNISGLFAAGDVTSASNHFHQVATSVSEGAIAANSAFLYLKK